MHKPLNKSGFVSFDSLVASRARPPHKGGSYGKRTTGRKWMRMREAVMIDEPLCRNCLANGRVTPTTEVDHIIAIENGGTDDRDNLQGLCTECHKDKTNRDSGYSPRIEIGLDGYPVGVLEK